MGLTNALDDTEVLIRVKNIDMFRQLFNGSTRIFFHDIDIDGSYIDVKESIEDIKDALGRDEHDSVQ